MTDALFSLEITPLSAVLKLFISFLLGSIIGVERQVRRQSAGMRTITLICIGSTAATLLSIWIPQSYPHLLNGDPGRIAAQIITGIGFLGAGAIMQSRGSVRGLTTAASIWVIAIVGMCVGAGLYLPAIATTLGTLFVLITLERVEKRKLFVGEVKVLTIQYSNDHPDSERVVALMKRHAIFVFNISISKDFENHTSQVHLRIQANPLDTFDAIFEELRSHDGVRSVTFREV